MSGSVIIVIIALVKNTKLKNKIKTLPDLIIIAHFATKGMKKYIYLESFPLKINLV